MSTDRVVLLTTEGESGRVAARYLAARFPALTVIVETPVSRSLLLRRRIKRLGLVHVGGQLAFMLFQRIQQRLSKSRITEIIRKADLDARWPDDREILRVPSVNSPECIDHLRRLQPGAILVMGTRIIGAEVLRSVDAPFINYHAGVTTKYRGPKRKETMTISESPFISSMKALTRAAYSTRRDPPRAQKTTTRAIPTFSWPPLCRCLNGQRTKRSPAP